MIKGLLAIVIVLIAACSAPLPFKSPPNCADKVAQSYASSSAATPGLWKCFSESEQEHLVGMGLTANDEVLGGESPYDGYSVVASNHQYVVYDLHINFNNKNVSAAVQAGLYIPTNVPLIVYVNSNGLVEGYGVGTPR